MIIKKSIKLALIPLGTGVLLLFAYNWLSEYLDFTSNQYLKDVDFGIYLVLILSFSKFIFDFYLIYFKGARVEITNKGILDKTKLINESFYAWSEIVNVEVPRGLFCEGLKVIYKKSIISENSQLASVDAVVINELTISDNEESSLRIILNKACLN